MHGRRDLSISPRNRIPCAYDEQSVIVCSRTGPGATLVAHDGSTGEQLRSLPDPGNDRIARRFAASGTEHSAGGRAPATSSSLPAPERGSFGGSGHRPDPGQLLRRKRARRPGQARRTPCQGMARGGSTVLRARGVTPQRRGGRRSLCSDLCDVDLCDVAVAHVVRPPSQPTPPAGAEEAVHGFGRGPRAEATGAGRDRPAALAVRSPSRRTAAARSGSSTAT